MTFEYDLRDICASGQGKVTCGGSDCDQRTNVITAISQIHGIPVAASHVGTEGTIHAESTWEFLDRDLFCSAVRVMRVEPEIL